MVKSKVPLHLQSGNRCQQLLVLSSLSPFIQSRAPFHGQRPPLLRVGLLASNNPAPQICPDICISEIPDPVTLAININHHSRQVVAYEYRVANCGEICFRYLRPMNIRSYPFCVSLISKDLTQHSHTYPAVRLSVESPPGYYLILVGTGEKEHVHLTVLMFLLPEPVSQTHLSV